MKHYLLPLFAPLFLLSCTSSNQTNKDVQIVIENAKPLSEIIENVRYVSLKSDKNIFSGRLDKIMAKGDTIYIQDLVNTNTLKAYRINGEFLFNVGRIGRGPKEYIEMTNFTIDNQHIYCIDNANRKLITYNINNGECIDKCDLTSFYASDLARFDDGNFIFFVDDEPSHGGGAFITNKDFEIIDKTHLTTEDNYCTLTTQTAFTQSQDKIIFSSYAKDIIVVFDRKSYKNPSYYVVNFGSKKACQEDKLNFQKLSATKHIRPPVYIVDNLIIGNANVPTTVREDYFMYGSFVYDINKKQTYVNASVEDILTEKIPMDDKLVFPFEGVVGNEIVSSLHSYDRYSDLVRLGFSQAPKHIEQQLKDGESILVFYSLSN